MIMRRMVTRSGTVSQLQLVGGHGTSRTVMVSNYVILPVFFHELSNLRLSRNDIGSW